jgi:hypothetical protein
VPKRTNTFQDVVSIIYEHLAGDASQEESVMLPNRVTGEMREVDVILRSRTAGHETVIAIEAASRSRRASVDWVEQMMGKHKHLPTDKVVLVAEAGFSKQAKALALAEQMVPLTPETLASDDPVYDVVNSLPSLWPKTITLSPQGARVWVTRPDGEEVWFKAPADLDLVTEDDAFSVDLVTFWWNMYHANFRAIIEQIGLADVAEDLDSEFVCQIGPPVTIGLDGETHQLAARWVNGASQEFHRIKKIILHGKAVIRLSEIKLHHKRLGELDIRYAYGEGDIGGAPALVVASEGELGGKLTVRVRDEPGLA